MIRRQQDLPISTRCQMRPAEDLPLRPRSGFTLVEMMVAVVILAVGLLGLASTAAYVVRQVSGGAQQSMAASVVQSRMEWMRSVPCAAIKESTVVTRGVTEHWVPGATVNQVLFVTDTVKYSVSGHPKKQTYTMTVPCW
jgi:prepilin-type N-terminal cleavage/methylation domain-containing protein